MKIKINTIFRILFCLFFLFSNDLFSESKTEGELLLESKRYKEAEKYAESALKSNPEDSKAEFILVKAWIGLGYEAEKKRNYKNALEYFEKAQSKWALNEEVQKEILKLKEKQTTGNTHHSDSENSEINELRQEILILGSELGNQKQFTLWLFGTLFLLFILQTIFLVFNFYRK